MAFKSCRREAEREIDDLLQRKNAAAGFVLQNGIKSEISRLGLIDTGRYISSVTSDSDETGAVAGTNARREGHSYPTDLEYGTSRGIRAYAPMRKAAVKSIPDLKRAYDD